MSGVKTITFGVDAAVFAKVPGYVRLVAIGIRASEVEIDVAGQLQAMLVTLKTTDEFDFSTIPSLEAWRTAFREVGINPSKFRPSVDALYRRAVAGTLSPLGEPLVDVGTICTLRELAPIGVHVLDEFISGTNLELRPARTGDRFVGFDGTEDNPDPGEVVYVTGDSRVLTRRWVWRQGRLGSVAPGTIQIAVNIDLIDGALYDEPSVVERVQADFGRLGFPDLQIARLDKATPSTEVTFGS